MRGGDRLYQRLIQENTTLPLTADQVHDLGLREVARIRGEMDAIRERGRLQRHARPVLRASAHRPPLRAAEPRGLRDGYYAIGRRSTRASARSSRPCRARGSRSARSRRSASATRPAAPIQDGTPTARGPASSTTTPTTCRSRRTYGMETLYLHEGAPGTTSRSAWRRRTRRCRPSCASAATPPSSRAGRSMPRPSGTSWAWRPIRTSGSAASTTRCCARCGWSSTPASTPRAGPASRRSTTCSPIRG